MNLDKMVDALCIIEEIKKLPEIKNLKNTVEDNDYHVKQSVYDHTAQVFGHVAVLVKELTKNNPCFESYLDENVGNFNKAALLFIASSLHDIGKPETLAVKEDGKTNCLNHAKVGAEKVNDILSKYGLNEKEMAYVSDVVTKHMNILNLYNSLANADKPEKTFEKARKKLGDKYIEILIHSKADLLACNGHPEEKPVKLYGQEFKNPIEMIDYLLGEAFRVKHVRGTVKELEQYVKQGTIYISEDFKPGVEQGLEFLYKQDMQKKVNKGKINPKKVNIDAVVDKRVQGMMKQLRFGNVPKDYKSILEQRPIEYNLT